MSIIMVFLHFRDSTTGMNKLIYHDRLARSLYLLKKRILHHEKEFNYWISLSFCNDTGYYTDKGYTIIYGKKQPHLHKEWIFKKNISHWDKSGKCMRDFVNKLRTYLKRHKPNVVIKYVWKYEEGKKSGRPHFHMVFGSNINRKDLDLFVKRTWDYGFSKVSKINEDEEKSLLGYLGKYFGKSTRLRYWKSGKKWGSSRNIKQPESPPSGLEFIGFTYGIETMELVRESFDLLKEDMGDNIVYYIRYISRGLMKDHYMDKINNLLFHVNSVMCFDRDKKLRRIKFLSRFAG